MPNVSLAPGKAKLTPAEMIADVEKGIYIVGDGSFSIDQQRYNASSAASCSTRSRTARSPAC